MRVAVVTASQPTAEGWQAFGFWLCSAVCRHVIKVPGCQLHKCLELLIARVLQGACSGREPA